MRILLVNGNFEDGTIGGTQTFTRMLADGLVGRGHTVAVLCEGSETLVQQWDSIEVFRVKIPQISIFNRFRFIQIINTYLRVHNPLVKRAVSKTCREFQPDICHVQMVRNFTFSSLTVFSRLGIPLVKTVHELFSLWNFNPFKRYSREKIYSQPPFSIQMIRQWHRHISKKVDYVCAPSQFALMSYLEEGYFAQVPNEVMPLCTQFDVNYVNQAELMRLEKTPGPTRFLYVGRLDLHKGIEELLHAVSLIKDRNIEMHFVGSGELGKLVVEASQIDSRVFYHGAKAGSKLADMYIYADVLLCPSTWVETFGLTIAEAFAHAMPCIASNVGSLPELVEHNKTGLITEPTVNGLLAAMRALVDSELRTAMIPLCAEKGRTLVLQDFLDRQLAVYSLCMSTARSS